MHTTANFTVANQQKNYERSRQYNKQNTDFAYKDILNQWTHQTIPGDSLTVEQHNYTCICIYWTSFMTKKFSQKERRQKHTTIG